ncbi:MAG: hypothetical protein PHO02_04375 [Candidatus Nanoarchaeia archaeon]|nr:hypothetical protein [Candidatus Nanoarchaeia archaeon]
MKIHYILAAVAVVLTALLFANATALPINTNVTNATFAIELSKSSFAANETLTGTLTIPLDIALDAEDEIELRIQLPMKRVNFDKTLASALTNASFTFTQAPPMKNVTNPSASKTLSFSNGGETSIAIKADVYSNFVSLDMDMLGSGSNTLSDVRIDVGNDGIIEWYYLGAKTGLDSEYTKPEGLGDSGGQSMLITGNTTMICQVIDLPFAKDFQIAAWYKRLNTAGNITAAIVTMDSDEAPIYLASSVLECDLPEHADFAWGSCTIDSTDYGLHGKYAVCIYSTNGTDIEMYEVKAAEGPSSTAHNCPLPGETGSTCTEYPSRNPQIKIKQGTYSKVLNGNAEFTAWDYEADAVKYAIEGITELSPSGICNDITCTIELKFIANNSGTIDLSNLDFKYKTGDVSSRSTEFYDIDTSEASIGRISKAGENITLPASATIEIPLEAFGIKAPAPVVSTANTGVIEARFSGLFANATITIGAGGTASPSSAQGMVEETRTALNAISALAGDAQTALKILGIDKDIEAALSEIGNISSRASADTPALRAEIESFRASLPKEVILGSSIKDFQLIELNDITSDVAPADKQQEVYFAQEKVQIMASVTTVSIKEFSGAIKKYALVKKEITAREKLGKFDIFEVIDKSVADSASDIMFETAPTSIVNADPVVKWFVGEGLGAGSKKEQRYAVRTEFDVPMEKVSTIIVPSGEDEESECEGEDCGAEEAVCGDGICTDYYEDETICPEDCGSKTPWALIIIIIIICLALAGYLLFYRGKYSLWHLTKKKKPFSTPAELESVKSFIRTSREKDMDDSVTKSRLHEKGWKEEQIKFAFAEMEWEKKEKNVEKPSENLSPVQEYIKTALSRNMPKEKILKNLVSKGWTEEDVKKELKI